MRQQFFEPQLGDGRWSVGINQEYGHVLSEFGEHLPACSTGAGSVECRDRDGQKLPLACSDSLKDSRTFGTNRQSVRGIFNIAARMDASILG